MIGTKKSEDPLAILESGKWNIGKEYSVIITSMIDECKQYQMVCYNGCTELIEDFVVSEDDKNKAKIFAMDRFVTTLLTLITLGKSQVKKEFEKEINDLENLLRVIYNMLPLVKIEIIRQNNTIVKLNKDRYTKVLQGIISVYQTILDIFTKSNIINYEIQKFDMEKAKNEYLSKISDDG